MFKNTLKLTGFILKRERISSSAWIIGTAGFNALIVVLMAYAMMATAQSRTELIQMFNNPALLAMIGPLHPQYGVNNSDFGYLYTLFMMLMVAIVVGIMNIFLVVRHTRTDEELGRYEVLRSLPSGRLANINAAMVAAVFVNITFAVTITFSMWPLMGLTDGATMDFSSALLWGVNIGVIGLVFAAIAALFSQLSSTA